MAFTANDDLNILQSSDPINLGAGAGNDTYIIATTTMSTGQTINITDTQGINNIKLIGGVTIQSSTVATNAIQLTLNNNTTINIFGADTFNYILGGEAFSASSGTSQSFNDFVKLTLKADIPSGTDTTNGTRTGESVNDDGTIGSEIISLTANASNIDEGNSATFSLTTANMSDGTTLDYTISGVSTDDIAGNTLTGTTTVNNNSATISIDVLADSLTEGDETLTVKLNDNTSASITINDTSVASPNLSLTAANNAVNEGETATFTFATTANNPTGTSVAYTISGTGISTDDFDNGALTGTATFDANGSATLSLAIKADATREGEETLTVSLDGENISASTTINDTSLPPTFTLTSVEDNPTIVDTTLQLQGLPTDSIDTLF